MLIQTGSSAAIEPFTNDALVEEATLTVISDRIGTSDRHSRPDNTVYGNFQVTGRGGWMQN
jgi:hypothetical protein